MSGNVAPTPIELPPRPANSDAAIYDDEQKRVASELANFPLYFRRLANSVNNTFLMPYDRSTSSKEFKDAGYIAGQFRGARELENGKYTKLKAVVEVPIFFQVRDKEGKIIDIRNQTGVRVHEMGHALAFAIASHVQTELLENKARYPATQNILEKIADGKDISEMPWFKDNVIKDAGSNIAAHELFAESYRMLLVKQGAVQVSKAEIAEADNFYKRYPNVMRSLTHFDKELSALSIKHPEDESFLKGVGHLTITKNEEHLKGLSRKPPQQALQH